LKLPNREGCFVPQSKLRDYLLSPTHPDGSHKARLFRALGFDQAKPEELEHALVAIAQSEEVGRTASSVHGVKYVVEGLTRTPSGVVARLRTVWMVDAGGDRPRLVTAYPVGSEEVSE
jgi:hypothetical protein